MAHAAPAVALVRPKSGPGRQTLTTPLVSVVVVNYGRWEETAALVDQLLAKEAIYHDRIEVIVIDNASPSQEGSAKVRGDERITFKALDENRGFGAGVNAGVDLSRAAWVLVLNPDVILCPGFVDRLHAAAVDLAEDASQGKQIGVVGFGLRNRDGSRQLSAGHYPTLGRMIGGLLRPRRVRKYFALESANRQRVPWVTGSCMLLRKDCLAGIEGFDEDYFLYYEDVDVCQRAAAAGWAVCFDPALEAVHFDPLQNRKLTPTLRAVTRYASLIYFKKHQPAAGFWGMTLLVRAEAAVKGLVAKLRGRHDEAWVAGQMWRYCGDLLKGKQGRARARLETILRRAGMQRTGQK